MAQAAQCSLPGIDGFLDAIVCDGRYLREFQREPLSVAHALGFTVSNEVAEKVSSGSMDELLAHLYAAKAETERKADPKKPSLPPIPLAVAINQMIVIVAVVIILVIVVIVAWPDRKSGRKTVKDNSENKDAKL